MFCLKLCEYQAIKVINNCPHQHHVQSIIEVSWYGTVGMVYCFGKHYLAFQPTNLCSSQRITPSHRVTSLLTDCVCVCVCDGQNHWMNQSMFCTVDGAQFQLQANSSWPELA